MRPHHCIKFQVDETAFFKFLLHHMVEVMTQNIESRKHIRLWFWIASKTKAVRVCRTLTT